MTSQSHSQDISPAESDLERVARKAQIPSVIYTPIANQKESPTMTAIRTTDIWNLVPALPRLGNSTCKGEAAVDTPVND